MVAAATWIARVKILEFAETRINFGARCVTAVLDNCATHQKGEVQKGEARKVRPETVYTNAAVRE